LRFAPKCRARDRCYFLTPFNQARNFSMKLDMPRTYASHCSQASTRSKASVEATGRAVGLTATSVMLP